MTITTHVTTSPAVLVVQVRADDAVPVVHVAQVRAVTAVPAEFAVHKQQKGEIAHGRHYWTRKHFSDGIRTVRL